MGPCWAKGTAVEFLLLKEKVRTRQLLLRSLPTHRGRLNIAFLLDSFLCFVFGWFVRSRWQCKTQESKVFWTCWHSTYQAFKRKNLVIDRPSYHFPFQPQNCNENQNLNIKQICCLQHDTALYFTCLSYLGKNLNTGYEKSYHLYKHIEYCTFHSTFSSGRILKPTLIAF